MQEKALMYKTWRKLKRIAVVVFEKLVSLTVFQSSFLLFVTFDIMLWQRYLFDTKLCFLSFTSKFHGNVNPMNEKAVTLIVKTNSPKFEFETEW